MTARINLDESIQGRPFAVGDALRLGSRMTRLNARDLEAPFWGVRAPSGSTRSVAEMARAYASRMQPEAFFSHQTAAELWEIPLPVNLTDLPVIHVSVADPSQAPVGRGVIGHRLKLPAHHITRLDGLRVTTLERTLLDLAQLLDDEHFVAAGDNVQWRRRASHARASDSSIARTLAEYEGRRGMARAHDLTPLLISRSDSPPESRMRCRFVRAALPEVTANEDIYDASGNFIAMVDLQFRRYKVGLDYEGDHHRTEKHQWRKDLRRVALLEDAGWHYTRISAEDLADSRYILARTRRILIERGWDGR